MFDTFKTEILTRLAPLTPTASGYARRNCPLCVRRGETADKKQRFGIKVEGETIIANCFNCNFKMSWTYPSPVSSRLTELMQVLAFSDEEIQKIKFAVLKAGHGLTFGNDQELYEALSTTKWSPKELPTNSMTIEQALIEYPENKHVLDIANYLLSRKIYELDRFYWSTDLAIRRRFIIPCYYNKRLVGYSARTVDPVKAHKYLNYLPENFVYNLDLQQSYKKKYLLITEGILDGYQTTGVSSIGAINHKQADIIDSLNKKCIVVPDRNRAGDNLVKMAIQRKWAVSFPKWEKHVVDPAQAVQEYGKLYTIESILDGIEENPVAIEIKRRFDR